MSGNAMEEGLMLQIHNPSHLDPSRIGFLAGALSGFAAIIVSTIALPDLPRLLAAYLALAVAAAVGAYITRRIANGRRTREDAEMIAARAMQEAETKRQISAMKVR